MNDLIFACQWKENRKNSWSDTHLSLYQSLSRYFDVIDYPLSDSGKFSKLFHKLVKRPDFGMANMKKQSLQFKADIKSPIFQFGETPYCFNKNQFVYQDLSVSYAKYMHDQEAKEFLISGFQNIPY